MFGLGQKSCFTCGIEMKNSNFKRFGKHFCSEEHAQQYVQEVEKARQVALTRPNGTQDEERGGCCC